MKPFAMDAAFRKFRLERVFQRQANLHEINLSALFDIQGQDI
jgi:hypothetical protein